MRCQVGEGPLWDERGQRLYFVDLVGRRLLRFDPASGECREWPMPSTIAAAALTESGGVVVALSDGFYALDIATARVTLIARRRLPDGTQFNDAKVDRNGRFVAVSMDRSMTSPNAGIFRLSGGMVEELGSGFTIGNGPCWSLDGKTFYCADSIPKAIYAYDYSADSCDLANRRLFADTTELGGIPDGATIDARGYLWMAICGGGKVVSFAPSGAVARVIDMPTPWVSSVMFGGPDLQRLYVTSLDPQLVGLPPDDHAGYLYVIDGLGAVGVAEPRVCGY